MAKAKLTNVAKRADIPLIVDMDNSLLKIDVLAEWTVRLAIQHPLRFLRGLASSRNPLDLKRFVANNFSVSSPLPQNSKVLDLLESYDRAGKKIYIASASLPSIVESVAQQVSRVSGVFSSEEKNLKGPEKAALLVERFGIGGFDYVGDSDADLEVWKQSRSAFFAGRRSKFAKMQSRSEKRLLDLSEEPRKGALLKAIRPEHWVKNVLVALPLILAGSPHYSALLQVFALALAFSLAASSLYLINDILDVDSDRLHSAKKKRSIAAGDLSAIRAVVVSAILFLGGLLLGALTSGVFGALLTLGYAALSFTYTIHLKRIPLIDVIALSSLYTFRIIAGAIITGTYISYWLMLFSFLTFAALATLKRVTEIRSLIGSPDGAPSSLDRRGYARSDEVLVTALGAAFSVASITVLGIYLQAVFGSTAHELASLVLVTCWSIWMLTMWFDQTRGRMHHDPIRHALTSPKSWVLVGIMLALYFWIGLEG